MTTEDRDRQLREDQRRGTEAMRIIESRIFQDVLTSMREEIMEAWKFSGATDEAARHNAYLMIRLLDNFEEQFVRTAATGKAAADELLNTMQKAANHG